MIELLTLIILLPFVIIGIIIVWYLFLGVIAIITAPFSLFQKEDGMLREAREAVEKIEERKRMEALARDQG